jgi:hypothetical protein
MKKRTLLLVAIALLTVSVTPAFAATNHAEKGENAGKHNFEQWQTIKRLEVVNH